MISDRLRILMGAGFALGLAFVNGSGVLANDWAQTGVTMEDSTSDWTGRIAPPDFAEVMGTGLTYDPAIPVPADVIGHEVGTAMTRYDRLVAYVNALAARSERITVEVIATTHQHRPILQVTTTSPANQASLGQIRERHLASLSSEGETQAGDDRPAIVQFVHGVHGDEISAIESSILLLYHLAAAQDETTRTLLDNAVILQTISLNPDGYDRYASWINNHHAARPNPDPAHREHDAIWPAGRVNHYWFDLNRQWLPATQVESRAVLAQVHRWKPQVVTDLHEMGANATFFFSPGPREGLHPLMNQESFDLTRVLHKSIADQLDRESTLHVTEEYFDDFYLGYGSSYPSLLGAIPFLFEQSSTDGIQLETENGLKFYGQKIGQQFRAALALATASMENRATLQDYQSRFMAAERQQAADDAVKAHLFTSTDQVRLAAFADLLTVHDVPVRRLAAPLTLGDQVFSPETTLAVPTGQAPYSLLQGLIEVRPITDKIEFYDVSGWSQQLAYGLEHATLGADLFTPDLLGADASSFEPASKVPERTDVAYVFDWSPFTAPRALNRILEAGLRAKTTPHPVTVVTASGSVDLGRGTVIVPVAQDEMDREALHDFMTRLAAEDHLQIHAATASVTPKGPDLGGFDIVALEKPSVLLVTGSEASQYDTGEIWFLLDYLMDMSVTMVDSDLVGTRDLSRYSHIVLAGGSYTDLSHDAVRDWVMEGGTLVAIRGGADWAITHELMKVDYAGESPAKSEAGGTSGTGGTGSEAATDESEPEIVRLPYAEKRLYEARRLISGAIFEGDLDITHPLGWGYDSTRIHLHRRGVQAFKATGNPFSMVVQYGAPDPLTGGYASEENRDRLAGMGAVMADRAGAGSIILFADGPFFRAYWYATAKVFMNSLFFSKAFTSHASGPYEKAR